MTLTGFPAFLVLLRGWDPII